MEGDSHRAAPSRTRLLPECEGELPPNPGVRTPTDGLLIDLGFDHPATTKMVSEVGSKSESCKSEFLSQPESVNNKELMEANFLGREYHNGTLWSDSPSPVVLFQGSRTAPVHRSYAAVNETRQSFGRPGHLDDLQHVGVNTLVVDDHHSLEGNKSSTREAKFSALMENITHQLHTLGYDWGDVRDYHLSPTSQKQGALAESTDVPVVTVSSERCLRSHA